jgi:hypothetical protein
LCNIPLENWGHYFPFLVAAWRFIQELRPDVLGELKAGYDKEGPWFKGKGVEIFDHIINSESTFDAIEMIAYPLVPLVSTSAKRRGFVISEELPQFDAKALDELSSKILEIVDKASKTH